MPPPAPFTGGKLSLYNDIVNSVYAEAFDGEEPLRGFPLGNLPQADSCSSPQGPIDATAGSSTSSAAPISNAIPAAVKAASAAYSVGLPQKRPAGALLLLDLPPDCLAYVLSCLVPAPQRAAQQNGGAVAAGAVARKISSTTGVLTDPGLRDAARAAMASKRLRIAYHTLLDARPDLSLQVEQNLRALTEKRRLVRRLTLTHHTEYMRREVCLELAGGCAFIAAVSLGCSAHPDRCGPFSGALNFAVFTLTHVLIHSAILMLAYRAAARLGARRALLGGCAVLLLYYCALVPAVQYAAGISSLPPELDLEPWCRTGAPTSFLCTSPTPTASSATTSPSSPTLLSRLFGSAPSSTSLTPSTSTSSGDGLGLAAGGEAAASVPLPNWPLAVLLWPFFGTTFSWRAIHVLSNGFAWVYGVWEFRASYGYVKSRNGL